MVIAMIIFVVLWLNDFPPDIGTYQTYFLRTIMTDHTLDYAKNCRVEFGTYAETHEDAPPTNTTDERSQGAIFLGPLQTPRAAASSLVFRRDEK